MASQKSLYKITFGLRDEQIMTYSSTSHTTRKELINRIMEHLE